MPQKPKFIHPLRAVRQALRKSQPEFAKMFGVSASYIQAVELGQRNLNDELADEIMLRFGVDAESLKRKRGVPQLLIGSGKERVKLWSGGRYLSHTADRDKAVEEYAALSATRPAPRRMTAKSPWKRYCGSVVEQRKAKTADRCERLRRALAFWQCIIVAGWKLDQPRVRGALDNKLELLFEAAERENKYYSVAMRLSRWIDNVVREYRLSTTINAVSKSRTGRDAGWPDFMYTLAESFQLKPCSRRCRR